MAVLADRMKSMRNRRRARELRLVVPDASSQSVRQRVASEVAALPQDLERDALSWIEGVSEFDATW